MFQCLHNRLFSSMCILTLANQSFIYVDLRPTRAMKSITNNSRQTFSSSITTQAIPALSVVFYLSRIDLLSSGSQLTQRIITTWTSLPNSLLYFTALVHHILFSWRQIRVSCQTHITSSLNSQAVTSIMWFRSNCSLRTFMLLLRIIDWVVDFCLIFTRSSGSFMPNSYPYHW